MAPIFASLEATRNWINAGRRASCRIVATIDDAGHLCEIALHIGEIGAIYVLPGGNMPQQ